MDGWRGLGGWIEGWIGLGGWIERWMQVCNGVVSGVME